MEAVGHPVARNRERVVIGGAIALTSAVGALVIYKASGAIATLAVAQRGPGSISPKSEWISTAEVSAAVRPLAGALNYLTWVVIALGFGILIGALVRSALPSRALARTLGGNGIRGQLMGAIAGAPLMLCSCCVAPVFEGVFERTRRLGPALGVMLAAPGLNPAALALTFIVFPAHLAWGRLVVSVALVLAAGGLIGRAYRSDSPGLGCALDADAPGLRELSRSFWASLRTVARRSLPSILLGVLASAALISWVPMDRVAQSPLGSVGLTIVITALAVPIALPTFGEIPIALALHYAGAPDAAVLGLLVAGPIVNLPSLLTLRSLTTWRVATATAAAVFGACLSAGAVVAMW